jgi:hypothetical protein
LELARPGYGWQFNQAFLIALRRLDERPHSFPPEEDAPAGLEVRYVDLRRYNYRMVFVVLGELKLVVAVMHNSQEPVCRADRLPPAQ